MFQNQRSIWENNINLCVILSAFVIFFSNKKWHHITNVVHNKIQFDLVYRGPKFKSIIDFKFVQLTFIPADLCCKDQINFVMTK